MTVNTPTIQEQQAALADFSVCTQHEHWTHQQMQDYRARALQACREYAYTHSPFYQRFHRGLMDRPLEELPVLTKAMMMAHFDELVTDRAIRLRDAQEYLERADPTRLFLDRYRVMATSGSSGQPSTFLYDRLEGAAVVNSFSRSLVWGGVTPESRAAAVTSTTNGTGSSQAPVIVDGRPVPRIQMSANDPIETIVQRLNEWQPDTLLAYASIAAALAGEQRQGRLQISPRAIFCAADTLTSDMRQRIEETWQTKLFNVYGTTEGGFLAAECASHQGLHLFEDFSIVEVVDQHNRPVPPGEQGEKVLLTVLFRHTQPLIRYELNDLVRPATIERCACGRPFGLLESIQGRTIEVLYFRSTAGQEEKIYPYLFHGVFNMLPVSGWQVIHERDGLHVFLTGAAEELRDEHVHDALQRLLIKRGVVVPPIAIHRVATLTKNAAGKTPTVISRVTWRAA